MCLTYLDYLTHRIWYKFVWKYVLPLLDIVGVFRQPRKMATDTSGHFKIYQIRDCCYFTAIDLSVSIWKKKKDKDNLISAEQLKYICILLYSFGKK